MERDDYVIRRMKELVRPIDEAILMCDDREEILMLSSILMIRVASMYDMHIGVEGRRTIFLEFNSKGKL